MKRVTLFVNGSPRNGKVSAFLEGPAGLDSGGGCMGAGGTELEGIMLVATPSVHVVLQRRRLRQAFMVVAVYGTLSDLLSVASSKLGIKATSVYGRRGGLIDDVALIRDDDVLFVCEGEPFIDPQTDINLPEALTGSHSDWITLNVGGRYFTTTRSTLVSKEPDSMLARMFKDK
ncbi:BTB/POZ domain-containing protein KCTD9, partial [Varanus komodoensis]